MSIITFFNQKGGVGKTTCSVLLIDYLIKQRKKILAIDLDPQGSLSETFLVETPQYTLLEFFSKIQTLKGCITHINSNLDLLASNIDLLNLPSLDSAYLDRLKLNFNAIFSHYDYVIIDTRPSLDWFSRLGIKLANYIIMPNLMSSYSYRALNGALNEIDLFKTQDFRRAVAFENMGRAQKLIIKEEYRNDFKKDLGKDFLDIKLNQIVEIDERSAQDVNYFDLENPKVKRTWEFFEKLLREVENV